MTTLKSILDEQEKLEAKATPGRGRHLIIMSCQIRQMARAGKW